MQKRAFLAPRRVRGGVQINRFGITPVELLGNWVTDHTADTRTGSSASPAAVGTAAGHGWLAV
jgi:hypothetical protein